MLERESVSEQLHEWVADMRAAGLKHSDPSLTALIQVNCSVCLSVCLSVCRSVKLHGRGYFDICTAVIGQHFHDQSQ